MFSLSNLDWPFPLESGLNEHFPITYLSDRVKGPSNTLGHTSQIVTLPSELHIQNKLLWMYQVSIFQGHEEKIGDYCPEAKLTLSNVDVQPQFHPKSVTSAYK